jgi:hypothetical protein
VTRIVRSRVRKRKSSARKPGGDAKAANAIRKAAQRYGKKAVEKLWSIATTAESDAAKIAALKEILDRGYGKESRTLPTDTEQAVIRRIERIIVDPKN